MNHAQRDLLAKSLADVAKGVFVGALLASGTGKLPLHFVLLGLAFACVFHIAAHILLGEIIMSDLEILTLFVGALAFCALGFALFDARKRKAKDKR